MELPEYRFYCHEQIRTELARHDIGDSPEWLDTKISDGSVHCISDEEIIDELHAIYSDSAEAMYANMLRNGCEAYEIGEGNNLGELKSYVLLKSIGGNSRLNVAGNEIVIPYEYIDYVIYNYNHNAIPKDTLEKVLECYQLTIITSERLFSHIIPPKNAMTSRIFVHNMLL